MNDLERLRAAARNADWQQVVLNGGPPCFHLEGERLCLRAQRWEGHIVTTEGPLDHKFISLDALLADSSLKETCCTFRQIVHQLEDFTRHLQVEKTLPPQ